MDIQQNNVAVLHFNLVNQDESTIFIRKTKLATFNLINPSEVSVPITDIGFDATLNQCWVRIPKASNAATGQYYGVLNIVDDDWGTYTTSKIKVYSVVSDADADTKSIVFTATCIATQVTNPGGGNSPYYNTTTSTWWQYSDTLKAFEDTGVGNIIQLKQELGDSETAAMSQKSVTKEILKFYAENKSNLIKGSDINWADGRVFGNGSFDNSASYKNTGFISYKGGVININKKPYRVSFFKEAIYKDESKFVSSPEIDNSAAFLEGIKDAKYFVVQFTSTDDYINVEISQSTAFVQENKSLFKFASIDLINGLFYGKWYEEDKLLEVNNNTFLIPIRKGVSIKAEGIKISSTGISMTIFNDKIAKVKTISAPTGSYEINDSNIEDGWAFVSFVFDKDTALNGKLKIYINDLPYSEVNTQIKTNIENIEKLSDKTLKYICPNDKYTREKLMKLDSCIVSYRVKASNVTKVGIRWVTHYDPTDRLYITYYIGENSYALQYSAPYNVELGIVEVENDYIYISFDFSKAETAFGNNSIEELILFNDTYLPAYSNYNNLLDSISESDYNNGFIELLGENRTIGNFIKLKAINKCIKEFRICRENVYNYFIRIFDVLGTTFRLQIYRNSNAIGYNQLTDSIYNFAIDIAELSGLYTISEPNGIYLVVDVDSLKVLSNSYFIFDSSISIWKIKDRYIYDTYPLDMSNYRNLFSMFWSSAYCIPWMYKRYVDANYVGSDGSNAYGTTPPYRKSTGAMNTCIVINTDPHECCIDSLMRINKWPMIDIDARATIDCFLNLGDLFVGGGSPTKDAYKKKFDDIWKAHDKLGYRQKPQLYALGNHDLNQDGGQSVSEIPTKEELYELLFKPMLARWSKNHTSLDTEGKYSDYEKLDIHTDENNPNKVTYYYVDFAYDKLRMIVMDNYDHPLFENCYSARGFSEEQLDFVKKAVDETLPDYCIWITSHEQVSQACGYNDSYNVMRSLLLAYANKTSISSNLTNNTDYSKVSLNNGSTIKTYSFNYEGRNGKIFMGHGHGHFFTDTISVKNYSTTGQPIVENPGKCTLGIRCFTFIASGARKLLHRGTITDGSDILVYDDEQGVRFVRYGCCPGRYGSKGVPDDPNFETNPLLQPTDGTDENGFYLVNTPWIPVGMEPDSSN